MRTPTTVDNRIKAIKWWRSLNINSMDNYSFRYFNKPFEGITESEIKRMYNKQLKPTQS